LQTESNGSMSEKAIQVDKVSKRYRIGEAGGFSYLALRDVLSNGLKAPLHLFRNPVNGAGNVVPDHIWALKDVDLEVKPGEIIGLIGRNGAGKTTLLKVLTRITKPTTGRVRVWGRVGCLLEVGTGFHPELTGRENVFLSGSILGMRKKEIQRKFDEIVAFAGVEKFIDTPSKHYSTGMYTRLAFAVAAHLEPEILLIDEVLAVGDMEFQKKCLGKMETVSQGGRAIIFVSHQMNQIRSLCQKVAWVDAGQIRRIGPTAEVVGEYEIAMTSRQDSQRRGQESARIKARFLSWEIVNPCEEGLHSLDSLGRFRVRFTLEVNRPLSLIHHGIAIYNLDRDLMWGTAINMPSLEPGILEFEHQLPTLPLKPGPYQWQVSLADEKGLVDLWDCIPELLITTEPLAHPQDEWAGFLNVPSEFSVYAHGQLQDIPAIRGSRVHV
jgi:lipopolysaccharide transport system ATP-binding protein